MKKLIAFILLIPVSGFAFTYSLISPSTGPFTNWSRTETQPAKGSSYTDNNANTSITRITNASDGFDATGAHPEYTFDLRSSDGHYAIFEGESGGNYAVYDLTASPPSYSHDLGAIVGNPNGQQPEVRWDNSGSHAGYIYYRTGMTLRYVDISDWSTHLVHDFSANISGDYIWSGDEGGPSEDSSKWVFMVRSGSNEIAVITYNKTTDTYGGSVSVPSGAAQSSLNNVYMSKSGAYFLTSNENAGTGSWQGTWSWNWSTRTAVHYLFPMSEHQAVAYDKQGNEVVVANNRSTDDWEFVKLSDGTVYIWANRGTWDASYGIGGWQFHAPGLAYKGWCFMGTYSATFTGWAYSQLFGIQLDENHTLSTTPQGMIWRVAQLQNLQNTYYQQPNISITEDGTQLYFGSDWRSTSNNTEVYRVNMPTNWYTDLGGTSSGGSTTATKMTITGKCTITGSFTAQ